MVLGSLHTDQFWVQDISAGFLGVFRVQQTYAVFGHLQWEDGKIWIDSRRWVYCLGRARSKGWQLVCSHPSDDTEDGNKMTTHAGFGSEPKKKSAGSITNVVSFNMISKANIFHVITSITLSLGYLPSENNLYSNNLHFWTQARNLGRFPVEWFWRNTKEFELGKLNLEKLTTFPGGEKRKGKKIPAKRKKISDVRL